MQGTSLTSTCCSQHEREATIFVGFQTGQWASLWRQCPAEEASANKSPSKDTVDTHKGSSARSHKRPGRLQGTSYDSAQHEGLCAVNFDDRTYMLLPILTWNLLKIQGSTQMHGAKPDTSIEHCKRSQQRLWSWFVCDSIQMLVGSWKGYTSGQTLKTPSNWRRPP